MCWLQLDRNFYSNPRIEEIKKLADGKEYIIIYLLLLLKGGERVPCDKQELARLAGVQADDAVKAMNAFYKQHMVGLTESADGKPSYAEVEAYAKDIGSRIDTRKFYDWYEADGFMYKGRPMDWRAKLRQWTAKERTQPAANPFLNILKEQAIEHNGNEYGHGCVEGSLS
jgi:hypothetical protein